MRKTNSGDLESQGYKLSSNKTFAKASESWTDNEGRLHFKHTVATGSPQEVKGILGAMKNGTKKELEVSHNVKVYERENLTPTCNGVAKEKEFVVVQSDNIGDGEAPVPVNEPTTETFTQEAPTSGLTTAQCLKNMIDKLIDAKNLQWVAIAGTLFVAALGLGFALS